MLKPRGKMTCLRQILFWAKHTYPKDSKKRWLVNPPKNWVALLVTLTTEEASMNLLTCGLWWNEEDVSLLRSYDLFLFSCARLALEGPWLPELRADIPFWPRATSLWISAARLLPLPEDTVGTPPVDEDVDDLLKSTQSLATYKIWFHWLLTKTYRFASGADQWPWVQGHCNKNNWCKPCLWVLEFWQGFSCGMAQVG